MAWGGILQHDVKGKASVSAFVCPSLSSPDRGAACFDVRVLDRQTVFFVLSDQEAVAVLLLRSISTRSPLTSPYVSPRLTGVSPTANGVGARSLCFFVFCFSRMATGVNVKGSVWTSYMCDGVELCKTHVGLS